MNKEIEKWKPLNVKKGLDYFFEGIEVIPTFFTYWGDYYEWDNDIKPIVFDIDNKNVYYFQSSYIDEKKDLKFFCNDIFVMNKKEFESFINYDSNDALSLNDITKKQLLNEIKDNAFEKDPNFSILDIYVLKEKGNKKITYYNPIYVCDKKMKFLLGMLDDPNMDFELTDEHYLILPKLVSNRNSKNSYNRNNYINGINFCIKFLEKHFPNDVQKFMEKQNVTRDWLKKNYKDYNIDSLKKKNAEKER